MTEKILDFKREKIIFWGLVGIFVLSLGFYMYCVRTTISNVVAHQNLENEAGALTLSIGNKEFEYITKRNTVTLALARSLGFSEARVKAYISRTPSAKVALLTD